MKTLDEIYAPDGARSDDARPDGQPEASTIAPPQPEPGAPPPPEPEASPDRPRDEAGRFAPKAEDQAATTPPPGEAKTEPSTVPLAALQAERAEKRALQERLAAFERGQAVQPHLPAPAPQPSREELINQFYTDPVAFLEQRDAMMQERMLKDRVDMSVAAAKARHADYPEAESLFERAVVAQARTAGIHPGQAPLALAALRHPDPAGFVYEMAKHIREQAKTPEQREAEFAARVEAEVAKRLSVAAPPAATRPPLPGTLADARGAPGGNRAPAAPGHRPLSAIFPG